MNVGIITSILESIVRALPDDILRVELDKFLDIIENKVTESKNKFDDATVIPLCTALRKQLSMTEEPGSKFADQPKTNISINVDSKPQ